MAGELILLTGGTGFVGYATLIEALKKGYRVRVAVRHDSGIGKIKTTTSIQPHLSQVEFVIVQDITEDGAFDEAMTGVDYVIHLASTMPAPTEDYENFYMKPAVRGTLSILHSALKHQSNVKRVVITASLGSILPLTLFEGKDPGVLTPYSYRPDPSGPYSDTFVAYVASKILAYNRTADFIREKQPRFTIINILPTYVIGKNELATTPEAVNSGSCSMALVPILGQKNPSGMYGNTVHVDDVAMLHVAALHPGIEGHRNFAATFDGRHGIEWDDALEIVKENFPKEVEEGIFPLGGSQLSLKLDFDASATEKAFDMKFKGFEEQILSLAGWYAKVYRKAHGKTSS